MKRILITGFSGMLGRSIATTLASNDDFELYGVARNEVENFCDIHQVIGNLTDASFIQSLVGIQPDIIIHSSALVNLNECEINNELAYQVNVETGTALAKLFPTAYFLYISTDSVFDGTIGNYDETAITNPINYYAYTKREGEVTVQTFSKQALILRTNIYGHKIKGNSLFDWAYQSLKDNQRINGFEDVYFNPLYTGHVAEIIECLLVQPERIEGILHLGAQDSLNKYEFLKLVAKVFDLDETLISATSIKDLLLKVERPLNTTLNISKLNKIVKERFSVEQGLQQLRQKLEVTHSELRPCSTTT